MKTKLDYFFFYMKTGLNDKSLCCHCSSSFLTFGRLGPFVSVLIVVVYSVSILVKMSRGGFLWIRKLSRVRFEFATNLTLTY